MTVAFFLAGIFAAGFFAALAVCEVLEIDAIMRELERLVKKKGR